MLGHIPAEGDEIEKPGYSLHITRMDRHRIAKVVVQVRSATIASTDGG